MGKGKSKVSPKGLHEKIGEKGKEAKRILYARHPHVGEFFEEKVEPGKIREHSARLLGAGAVAGALILASPETIKALPPPHEVVDKLKNINEEKEGHSVQDILVDTLRSVLPEKPRPLDRREEKFLEQIFVNLTGITARATLEGEHLNTTYGYIGSEQHLRRYPGDVLSEHSEGYLEEGLAPGLGAWGYFATSKDDLTVQLEEIEKWYAVVQTLYLPDWNTRQPYLKNWYKYRKVLIVNTQNGNAVVASIADSGPAAWTGKQFGGSPEVMRHLGGDKYKKGPVVVFFVDDPENKVPLGPVDYNRVSLEAVSLEEI
jgi:hypothetical protein